MRLENPETGDWHESFVGLGSNLGDRQGHLREATSRLEESGSTLVRASPIYITEPVDFHEQDWFLNQVLHFRTRLNPMEWLQACLHIEQIMGRLRKIPRGPRTIDIDLLLYDELILDAETLILPHPRMHLRRFVLEPLSNLAPDSLHPILRISISHLLERCADPSVVLPFEDHSSVGYQS
jgi:2-amino-4-hydroxy-6-hydroxymethyldihydropteridine diphosphokinase